MKDTDDPTWNWLDELKKQSLDQSGHAVWGMITGALPRAGYHYAGVEGWLIGTGITVASMYAWTMREGKQRENGSRLWWDPWLDSAVFFLFVGVGAVVSVLFWR